MSPDASPPKPKRPLLQQFFHILVTLALGYALLSLAVWFLQRRLIYIPTQLSPELAETLAAREGFKPWRNRAGQLMGWHLAASATPAGTVLVVHGNAGCAVDRSYLATPIHDAAPVDVYVLEYPGYGARKGAPSQSSILAAAAEAFALLTNGGPIYIVGESLGAGAAAHLASTHPGQVSGLLLFAPYNNLMSVGQRQMPLLPVSLLLRDRFDPAKWLKEFRGPVVFVVAGADRVIPPDLGRKLHDGYAGPKMLQVIPGAGHNDLAAKSPEWWKKVFSFWQGDGTVKREGP